MLDFFNLYTYIFTFGGLVFVTMLTGLYLVFYKPTIMHNDLPRSAQELRLAAGLFILIGGGFLDIGGILQLFLYNTPSYDLVAVYTLIVSAVITIFLMVNWLLKLLQHRTRPMPLLLKVMEMIGTLVSVVYLIHDCIQKFDPNVYSNNANVLLLGVFASVWASFIICFFTWYCRQVSVYHHWLKENYSDISDRNLRDLLSIAVSLALLLLMIFAVNLMKEDFWWLNTLFPIVAVLTILQILYFTERLSRSEIKKIEIASETDTNIKLTTTVNNSDIEKTEGSNQGSSTDDSLALINELLDKKLVEDKLYLNPDLTLEELAQHLHTNRSYVSRCFSLRGTTFYNFINNLRIQHAIELLKEDPTIKQADLALRCGYNYRQAMTRNFQTVTGMSIVDYIKNLSE